MEKYYINQENWQSIYSILQGISGIRVKQESVTHTFIEGVYFILKTGAQWRELPSPYGKWRSIHKRYESWCRKGVWSKVLDVFSIGYDGESIMIDATIVRAHPCAAGYKKDSQAEQALGRSKGGFTTKIHAVVDALGQALRFSLTAGQRHDITQAPHLIEGFKNSNVIADKGYDSKAFIGQIEKQHCTPVIPPRSNRKDPRHYDEHLYKERHLVECFFNKIKHFRRVFSRFDKKASSFMGFLAYASIVLWLR
jgi:transposase